MTEAQKQNLKIIATEVISTNKPMTVTEMINRVLALTGYEMSRCIEGYRLMRQLQFIPDRYVLDGLEGERALMAMFQKKEISELVNRFGLIFINHKAHKVEVKQAPKPSTVQDIASSFDLQVNF